jgi:hypothetical protein
MLFRISFENFLVHAIDHFTRDELLSMHYAIISAVVRNGGRMAKDECVKINQLYPSSEIVVMMEAYSNKEAIEKAYLEELKGSENLIYLTFVVNILAHKNVCIVCCDRENLYIDILTNYLKKNYSLDCIDLNKLFMEGKVNPISINLNKIHNKSVSLRKSVIKDGKDYMNSTRDGRLLLLQKMNKQDKIKKLKELGIKVRKIDHKDLDELLLEEWVGSE